MGICSSNQQKSSSEIATIKLILENGELEEFINPVTVSQILKTNPNIFICKADDMNYDDYISAVDGDEELQADHLYFALPVSWLSCRLKPQEMAALAVKASLALTTASGDGEKIERRRLKRVNPIVYDRSKSNMMALEGTDGGRLMIVGE